MKYFKVWKWRNRTATHAMNELNSKSQPSGGVLKSQFVLGAANKNKPAKKSEVGAVMGSKRSHLVNLDSEKLELAEARSRQILIAMVAFGNGDFSLRLPTHWADVDGQIAIAFNLAIAHQARIAAEVDRLSVTVGKEGRLKQRMSVPGAVGGWARSIPSIR